MVGTTPDVNFRPSVAVGFVCCLRLLYPCCRFPFLSGRAVDFALVMIDLRCVCVFYLDFVSVFPVIHFVRVVPLAAPSC